MDISIIEKIRQIHTKDLAFVFDFDGTIHKQHKDGKQTPSIISILRNENILGEKYSEKARVLSQIYHPIEKDPSVSREVKIEKMKEWWQKHIELLIENKLSRKIIEDISNHPLLIIREGIIDLFTFAKNNDVPIIIFSASGTGSDSIKYFLERHSILFENVTIISNIFHYEKDLVVNIVSPIIHALNKNESILNFFPETKNLILSKKSVLLIGDSLHDVDMAENKNHLDVIRIGLLNELEEEKKRQMLPFFKEKFDIVIEGDGSLEPIYKLLAERKNSDALSMISCAVSL